MVILLSLFQNYILLVDFKLTIELINLWMTSKLKTEMLAMTSRLKEQMLGYHPKKPSNPYNHVKQKLKRIYYDHDDDRSYERCQ